MKITIAPGRLFLIALAYAVSMAIFASLLALKQPWLGVTLEWDNKHNAAIVINKTESNHSIKTGTLVTHISNDRNTVQFSQQDFIAEPASALSTLTAYDQFLDRQQAIFSLLETKKIMLIATDNTSYTLDIKPHRPLSSLSPDFWIQIFVGFFAWLIVAGVWVFRHEETSAHYLLLNGFSTSIFTSLAAIYSTRELALPSDQFRWLCDINFLGGAMYAATMAGLLWYYPKRIGKFPVGPLLLLTFAIWWIVQELRLVDSMLIARRSGVFFALITTFIFAGIQWFNTRKDPVLRASLQWFLLSWLVGITLFILINFIPQAMGIPTGEWQGYSFALFLLIYIGLAFGILRYRLFDLDKWWFRVLFWMGGLISLLFLDALFLWGLNLSTSLSFGLALLLSGVLWLPFRSWVWGLVTERISVSQHKQLTEVLSIAFIKDNEKKSARWKDFLTSYFSPLKLEVIASTYPSLQVVNNGQELIIPAQGNLPSLKLEYANQGKRLFNPQDIQHISFFMDVLDLFHENQAAYSKGAREERSRIARDLHDDIGSTLLTALHHSTMEQSKAAISRSMMEMQTIIRGLTRENMTLGEILAELRHETYERFEAANIAIEWPWEPVSCHNHLVHYSLYKNYISIMRELVANIIRHADAKNITITVHCNADTFTTLLKNDGIPFDGRAHTGNKGNGLGNLEKRLRETQGQLDYTSIAFETVTTLTMPLKKEP